MIGALALTSPLLAATQRVVVPAIFEEFEAPGVANLYAIPARGAFASRWKLETLVLAGEVGRGPLVVARLGLRADASAPSTDLVLRGSVTLSTSRAAILDDRFAANAGESPVTFFVTSREMRRKGRSPVWSFELAGGFRFDPAADGNLLLHFELQADNDVRLDVAPSSAPRLLLASDFLAPSGQLAASVPVLELEVERDPLPPPPPPDPVVAVAAVAEADGPATARPAAAAKPAAPAVPVRLRGLEEKIQALTAQVEALRDANRHLATDLAQSVRTLAEQVTRHDVETALASGRPSPALLRGGGRGGRLEVGRAIVKDAIDVARAAQIDVSAAAALLAEGEERIARGEPGLAFMSWSLAFRSALSPWRPFAPEAVGREQVVSRSTALRRQSGPYDLE